MRKPIAGWAGSLALLMLMGCGADTGTTFPVTGIVTVGGEPVPNATVTFTPENGRSATGVTGSDGRFTLSTFRAGDGAVPGKHTIVVIPFKGDEPEPMPGTPEAVDYKPPASPFNARYSDPTSSGLTENVQSGAPNDFKIELQP